MRSIEIGFSSGQELLGLFGVPSRRPRDFEYYNMAGFLLRTYLDTDDVELKGISISFSSIIGNQSSCYRAGSTSAQNTCQQTFNENILIGARPLLDKARITELKGCIDASQKERWLQIIATDRRLGHSDAEKMSLWQKAAWKHKLVLPSLANFNR